MKVRDVMQSSVVVGEDESLGRALQLMLSHDLRHVLVQGPHGRITGVVSECDVLRAHHESADEHVLARPVRDVMGAPPPDIDADAPLAQAAARLATLASGCMPVLEQGLLVGLITAEDVLAVVAQVPIRASADGARDQVRTLMRRDPIAAHPDDRVLTTAAKMLQAGVRHICVVDGDERVIGMLSDRDVRKVIGDPHNAVEAGVPQRVAELRVGSAMTPNPRTVQEDAPVSTVLEALLTERFGALPVVDAHDRLRGIVSYLDVLRHLASA